MMANGPLVAAASRDAYTLPNVNQHAALKNPELYNRLLRASRKTVMSRNRTCDGGTRLRADRTTAFLERVHALLPPQQPPLEQAPA